MSDDRPSRYVEDGVVVYRASALGSCPKVLVALGLGMTPEPFPGWLLEKFSQGVAGEPVVLAMLADEGWTIYDAQQEVELWVGSRVVIRGHLDAVGVAPVRLGPSLVRVVEVKCVAPDYADEIKRSLPPLYHWQCAVYGRAMRLPVLLVLGIKDDDGVVRRLEYRDVDVAGPAAIKLRVMDIERHIAAGTWPECTYRQFPCPFPELCDDPIPEGTEAWELEARLMESLVHVRH